MLEQQQLATPRTKKRLLDVVNQWAFVFYYKGMNRKLLELLEHQQLLLEGLDDPIREGFHWAWHGCALWHRHRFAEAFESLCKALYLGKNADHSTLIGYACTWLSWPCTELGLFDQAIHYSERAEALFVENRVQDAYIYFNSVHGKAYAYWHKGNAERTKEAGNSLIRFGKQHGNIRSLVSGHCGLGWSDLVIGDLDGALKNFRAAVDISADPWYSQFPKLALCYGAISNGKLEEALPLLDHLIAFSEDNGAEFVGEPARFFKALTHILNGKVTQGLTVMEGLLEKWMTTGCKLRVLTCGYVLARLYFKLRQSSMASANTENPSTHDHLMADNCLRWFQTCISEAREMGARTMEGRSLMGLGDLYAVMGEKDKAKKVLTRSIELFEQTGESRYLEEARTSIERLSAT